MAAEPKIRFFIWPVLRSDLKHMMFASLLLATTMKISTTPLLAFIECLIRVANRKQQVFDAKKLFGWLLQENISFYIRIKKNFLTTDSRGRVVHVHILFRDLASMSQRVLYGKRKILGHWFQIIVSHSSGVILKLKFENVLKINVPCPY